MQAAFAGPVVGKRFRVAGGRAFRRSEPARDGLEAYSGAEAVAHEMVRAGRGGVFGRLAAGSARLARRDGVSRLCCKPRG